jgi:ribose transport system substrate-binding protein
VPYWQSASAGFSQAGGRLGVAYAFNGPDTYDPGAEHTTFEAIIQKKPSGILVSVADPAVIKYSID